MNHAITPKDVLLTHLDYTFEKEAWQPSLAMAVQGLTAAQAAWKPGPNRHSIWQIVRHVTRWKQATLEAWQGARPLFSGHTETQRFNELMRTDWCGASGTDEDWQADVRALHDVSLAVRDRAGNADAEDLLRPFPGEDWGPAVLRVLRMATHDIYHAGQIRYLRALQGA
jgi:DinB superfamily